MPDAGKVAVVGSFVVDLMGRAGHLPLPGETVLGSSFKAGPGGKGSNQAVAAHRAGADVVFVSRLGGDLFSSIARDFYKAEGMSAEYLSEDPSEPTGSALILVDENTSQNSILVAPGACTNLSPADLAAAQDAIHSSSVLLTQLETNLDILKPAVDIFRSSGAGRKTAVLNPAPAQSIKPELLSMFDIITPNEVEASILSGVEVTDLISAEKAADIFIGMGVDTVIITLGEQGLLIKNGETVHIPAFSVNAVDTTGAGDAFNGAFAASLSRGCSIYESARYGSAAAALSVTKIGTAPAMPFDSEIAEIINKDV